MTACRSELEGKVVVVIGSGHGIGREIAKEFTNHGATVVVADINEQAAKEAVQQICCQHSRDRATAIPFDLGN